MKLTGDKRKTEINLAIFFVLAGSILRFLPHPDNFTPVTALALFSGAFLSRRLSVAVPLLTMMITDFFIGFHSVILFTWGSLVLTVFLGRWVSDGASEWRRIAPASLSGSLLFFVVTNFGHFVMTHSYPHTWQGLWMCYTLAIPFFRNALLGDLFYTTLLFGLFVGARQGLRRHTSPVL